MGIKDWKRMNRHKDYLLSRILELRQEIFFDALNGQLVSETKRECFIKYNNKLKLITKYKLF
tara:strand:- start:6233 stop:6418 length:186 start_codon:yes stop_codon:yes gene_type:complete